MFRFCEKLGQCREKFFVHDSLNFYLACRDFSSCWRRIKTWPDTEFSILSYIHCISFFNKLHPKFDKNSVFIESLSLRERTLFKAFTSLSNISKTLTRYIYPWLKASNYPTQSEILWDIFDLAQQHDGKPTNVIRTFVSMQL